MITTTLDIADLQRWIGRTETRQDTVSPRLVRELSATLGSSTRPIAVHWCLAPTAVPETELGPDGHPARGGFLPPVPLPRRMWAGSALTFHDRLEVGDAIEWSSTVRDVVAKVGQSGPLCFVVVEHWIATDRGPAIEERQTIVYRDQARSTPADPSTRDVPSHPSERHRTLVASTTQLFRYSALTFNGHRIHYDREYAREVEHYPGLVVHGPLLATQLLELAAVLHGNPPRSFSFRGLRPVYDATPYHLCGRPSGASMALWVETDAWGRMMEADAQW